MIDRGDIRLADVHDETRRCVLIVSDDRFHRRSERVIVAPEIPSDPDQDHFPWRIRIDERVFAVDLLRNLRVESVLERIGRAPVSSVAAVRRSIRAIT